MNPAPTLNRQIPFQPESTSECDACCLPPSKQLADDERLTDELGCEGGIVKWNQSIVISKAPRSPSEALLWALNHRSSTTIMDYYVGLENIIPECSRSYNNGTDGNDLLIIAGDHTKRVTCALTGVSIIASIVIHTCQTKVLQPPKPLCK